MDVSQNLGMMLHKIGAMMERFSDDVLFREYGMGFSQFKILYILREHPSVAQKEIALYLGQSEPSITRQIKILLAGGYVLVGKGEDDKKKRIVTLTQKGESFIDGATTYLDSQYRPIISSLSLADQELLLGRLQLLLIPLESACRR